MSTQMLSAEARFHLEGSREGILSTLSTYLPGWPFGSLAPFALSPGGEPILLLSGIAEHSRNAAADDRASLLCLDPQATDPQASWRLTLLGHLRKALPEEHDSFRAAYLERFPQSEGHFQVHDFALYRLALVAVRYIAGFGSMDWLPVGEVIRRSADPVAPHAEGVLEHMNQDHGAAMQDYVRGFFSLEPEEVRLGGVDSLGFDLEASVAGRRRRLRVPFTQAATTVEALRQEAVRLLGEARSRLGSL